MLASLGLPSCMVSLAKAQADADLRAGRHAAALAGYDLALRLEVSPEASQRAEVAGQRKLAAEGVVRQGLALAAAACGGGHGATGLGRYTEVERRAAELEVDLSDRDLPGKRQACRQATLQDELTLALKQLQAGEIDQALADLTLLDQLARAWDMAKAECAAALHQAQGAFLKKETAQTVAKAAPAQVAATFTRLAGLRQLALTWRQPEAVRGLQTPLLAAAESLWTQLQPHLAQPGHVRAVWAAESLAAAFAPDHAFAQRVAPLRALARQEHLRLAEAMRGQPMTQRLHLHVAKWLGAHGLTELAALDKKAAQLAVRTLVFAPVSTGACQELGQRVGTMPQGAGLPVQVVLELGGCKAEQKRWQTQESYTDYKSENYTVENCKTTQICTSYKNGACVWYSEQRSCSPYTASRTVPVTRSRNVQHLSHSFGFAGNARLTWEDGALTVPLAWQDTVESRPDDSDGGAVLLPKATAAVHEKLVLAMRQVGELRGQALLARAAQAQQTGDVAAATEAWLSAAASQDRVPALLVSGPGQKYGLTGGELAALVAGEMPKPPAVWQPEAIAVPSTARAAVQALLNPPSDAELRDVLFAPPPDSGQALRKALVLKPNRSTEADPEPALTVGLELAKAPLGAGTDTRGLQVSWRNYKRRLSMTADLPAWGGRTTGFALSWTWPWSEPWASGLVPIVGVGWASRERTDGTSYSNLGLDLGAVLPVTDYLTVWTRLEPNLLRLGQTAGPGAKITYFTPIYAGVDLHLGTRVLLRGAVVYYFEADLALMPLLSLGVRL